MTLDASVQVPVPDGGVTVCRTGYRAVYKIIKAFRNSKGQPTSERVLIGRMDPETNMLIPNQKYWKYFGDSGRPGIRPEEYSIRYIGASFLVGRIMSSLGVSEALDEGLGVKRASLVRTAANHMVTRGNVFERVKDYCQGYTLTEAMLTSQSSSDLFSSITHQERMGFFKRWLAKQAPDGFLAYDVTSFSTYAKAIMDKEWGHNRDDDNLPQINLGCFLSETTGLPVFYVTYQGSITDKAHLPYMMAYNEDLGISKVGFVLDRGFCSTDNVKHMAREGLDFIIGVEKRHKTTRLAINYSRPTIRQVENLTKLNVHAFSSKGIFYGTNSVMHVYYDPDLATRQMRHMVQKIESLESELIKLKRLSKQDAKRYQGYFKISLEADGSFAYERDRAKIEAKGDDCGFYCLLTNTSLDAYQTLVKYRRKDVIEKGFDDVKNYIRMKGLRTHNTETTDGKLFCAFIALIVASEIGEKLGDFMRKKSWSKSDVIAELEKIRVTLTANGNRLLNPVTKTQRTILDKFGLTEDDIVNYVTSSQSDARKA